MRHGNHVDAVIDELQKHGATVLRTVMGGVHPRVYFRSANGKEGFIVTAGSGSDRRGPLNARQDVRRVLGVQREKIVAVPKAKPVRRPQAQSAKLVAPKITAKADPWRGLLAAPSIAPLLPGMLDRAWARLFGECLRAVGHEPVNPQIRKAMGRL